MSSFQRPQLDVLEPARAAVVLQTDIPSKRMISIGNIEFMLAAVRAFVGFCKLAQIRPGHLFAVERHVDQVAAACDLDVIPFADGLHGVLGRFDQIVDGARIVVARPRRIVDRDFQSIEADIFSGAGGQREGADEDSAVAAFADFEIDRSHEVVPLLRMHKHVVTGLVGVEHAALDRCARRRAVTVHPAGVRFAVEEQQPARAALSLAEAVVWPELTFSGGDIHRCQQGGGG